MEYLETQANGCLLKLLGAFYMEKELGDPKDKGGKDALASANKLSMTLIDELNGCYQAMKSDARFSDSRVFCMLKNVFEAKNQEVEKAKKLLEKSGYKVTK